MLNYITYAYIAKFIFERFSIIVVITTLMSRLRFIDQKQTVLRKKLDYIGKEVLK